MNAFIKTFFLFVHMKFGNVTKTDHFFPAFLHKKVIYSSKIKVISMSTPNTCCFLFSQNFVFPIFVQIFSHLNTVTSKAPFVLV